MYDLDKHVFRLRELAREPLPMSALRFASAQEEKADRFIAAKLVTIATVASATAAASSTAKCSTTLELRPMIVLDNDDRLIEARCDCYFYGHNKLMRGPCEHMLALRRRYHGQVALPRLMHKPAEACMKRLRQKDTGLWLT